MIAPKAQDLSHDKRAAEEYFLSMLPRIRKQAHLAFRYIACEDREEFTAEVVARAYCGFVRLVERGMSEVAYPTPLAQYAIRQVRCGRRVGTKLNKRDVSTRYCQKANGILLERLDQLDPTDGEWKEVLVEDNRSTPAEIAGCKIDFGDWQRRLSSPLRRIAKTLATGECTSSAAARHGVSPGRISQIRRELKQSWELFQGAAMKL